MRQTLIAAFLALLVSSPPALADMLLKGSGFPEWTLIDQKGASVSSKDYAGKRYLLWFYPKARTPG